MTQSSNGKGTWLHHARAIKNSSRNMGIYCLGGRGTGKSWLLALAIAWQDFLANRPQVIFDPLGTIGAYFLYKLVRILTYFPKSERAKVWERIIYCDMSGQQGFVSPFPLYYRRDNETLQEISERVLTVVELSNPGLVSNAPVTWPSTRRLGVNAGTILSSLGLQVTELEDLLFNTLEWEKSGRFQEAITRDPDAIPAVSYFRNSFIPMSRTDKSRLVSPLLDHVFKLTSDKNLRAVFGARAPGIYWEDIAAKGQTVLLNFSGISNPATKRFALLWTFSHLYEFIKQRNRSDPPFGIIIDEFVALATKVADGTNPLGTLFDELINQYMRNANIWLTLAHQNIQQLDDQLRNTVLSLGNYVFGQAPTMPAARILADAVYLRDPYWVKHYRQSWGRTARRDFGVISEEPVYFSLEEQRELFAQKLRTLQQREFLLRPAEREGEISTNVYPITIRSVDLDPVTGEYHYPDQQLLDTLLPKLAAKSGVSVSDILKEQEVRLTTGTPKEPPQTQAIPADEIRDRQATQRPDATQPEQSNTTETYSRPILDETERAFLAFLLANAETPVSALPKELRISAAQGTIIRERLHAHGLIEELDVRTGRSGAGRPTKFVIPTFRAFEFMEREPPQGRGSVVHRALQQAVSEGALAKGYSTNVEHRLSTGAIVDVHLEKWQEKIAVEIAVLSKPQREIAHIKQHVAAGYDKVYAVFVDPHLLEKTSEALTGEFTDEERAKIHCLPVSKLYLLGK